MKEQKTTLAVKIDYSVAQKVKSYCRERGVKYGFFIEKAIVAQMEREELKEDLLDMKTLRELETRAIPLDEYAKKRRI